MKIDDDNRCENFEIETFLGRGNSQLNVTSTYRYSHIFLD